MYLDSFVTYVLDPYSNRVFRPADTLRFSSRSGLFRRDFPVPRKRAGLRRSAILLRRQVQGTPSLAYPFERLP
jgi:hypothetical protein